MKKHKQKYARNFIIEHIKNNQREYLLLLLIFVIGIVIGIFVTNHLSDEQKAVTSTYMQTFIDTTKENLQINYTELLKDSLTKNIILSGVLWLLGITITLVPAIYGVVCFRGFCLGYTISSTIAILGIGKGLLVAISLLLLQNLLIIPVIFAIAQSGIQINKRIIKRSNEFKSRHGKESIKIEILRHSVLCIIMTIILGISSLIETYISSNLFELAVKFI